MNYRRANVAALVLSLLPLGGCDALCGSKVLAERLSPDHTKRAVFFTRSCGFTWNLSILGVNEQLRNNAGGNVIAGDVDAPSSTVKFGWQGSGGSSSRTRRAPA